MLQVRNLSEQTHRELKVRAARAGMSLSDYVAAELDRCVAVPTVDEFLDRIGQREPVEPATSAVTMLHEGRRW